MKHHLALAVFLGLICTSVVAFGGSDQRHTFAIVGAPVSLSSRVNGHLADEDRINRYKLAALQYQVRVISVVHLGVMTHADVLAGGMSGTIGLSGTIGRVVIDGGAGLGSAWLWHPQGQPAGVRADVYAQSLFCVSQAVGIGVRIGFTAAAFGSNGHGTSNYYWTFPAGLVVVYRL